MTVLVAENTPDKVRGLLKRWFIEPKPNVFVGSVNRKTREKVLQYILRYSPEDLALLVIFDDANSQGFCVRRYRDTTRCERQVSGHYLLAVSADDPREAGSVSDSGVSQEELRRVWEPYIRCFITYEPKAAQNLKI